MDPSFLQTIAPILAFFVVFTLCRFIRSLNGSKQTKGKTNNTKKVPELSGALPFIGHLHLLSNKVPYFRTFSNIADKYGPIFSLRLGCRNTIVVNNREIAKECLTTNDRVFASQPDTAAGRYLGYNNAIFGLAPYGQYWREMRKIATLELLSSHRLEKLKYVRDKEIYSLVKDLYNSCVKNGNGSSMQVPITISRLLEHLTSNINVQMIAGKRFCGEEAVIGGESWRLKKAIRDATYLCGVFVVEDAIPSLGCFDFKGYVGFMKRTFKEIDLILEKWLHEHVKKKAEEDENGGGGCENDFMDVLISTFEEHDVIYGHKRDIVIKATTLSLFANKPPLISLENPNLNINISKKETPRRESVFLVPISASGSTHESPSKAPKLTAAKKPFKSAKTHKPDAATKDKQKPPATGHERRLQAKMLILTGSGSTAITLTWALSLLLNNPSALKQAQKELDTKIGKTKWVQESDIKDLKFLQAIIKETLRLYPPAPLTGIREAIEDTIVAGYNVKKGTRLLINLWKIQRDPKVWSNPDEFQPERFMNNSNNCEEIDYVCGKNFEFIPFSFGRRSCPGMTFGMQVVHLTLARLVQGFEMKTEEGVQVDMGEGLGVALPKESALEVFLIPRLPLELYEQL